MTGTCALCKNVTTLRESHIVPAWVYKRAIHLYPDGNNKWVRIGDGVAMYGDKQLREHMLCDACEHRFKGWEDHAADVSFQRIDASAAESFPALEAAKIIAANETYKVADVSALDVDALGRFALSVIWRAGMSREHFEKIHLGPYSTRLASYLLDDATPFPDWAMVVLNLIEPSEAPLDRIALPPWSAKSIGSPGFRIHSFVVFGLWFQIFIGNRIPNRAACLGSTGRALVTNGALLLDGVHDLATRVRSVGALARRKP